MKRDVRRACRFGCVVCGMPIFDYDHIEDFAIVQTHEADNIVLLCPVHHRAKTNGHLSAETVREARLKPFNADKALTQPYGLEAAKAIVVMIGSSSVVGPEMAPEHSVLWVNGQSFVTIHQEGGTYTYSAVVTDSDGQVLLKVDHGEIVIATDVWDYRYEGRTMTIRRGAADILFEAEITDALFAIRRGTFVDEYDTGLVIGSDGTVHFMIGRMLLGSFAGGQFAANKAGAVAVWRESSGAPEPPPGFGMVRAWPSRYERHFADLQLAQQRGAAGDYPADLHDFRPRL